MKSDDAQPEIHDPAVASTALRAVDPCAMLTQDTLAQVGTVEEDSTDESEWGSCMVDVRDTAGKEVHLSLTLGDNLVSTSKATDNLAGLPLQVDKGEGGSCFVSVVTSRKSVQGITFQVDYPGGDACAAGRTGLEQVVRVLHANPPKYQPTPRTVGALDPCDTADRGMLTEVIGKNVPGEPQSLHSCDFWKGFGTYPMVSVRFQRAVGPDPADGTQIDLGGGVTAVQEEDRDISDVTGCKVSWLHVATPGEDHTDAFGEVVSVEYSNKTAAHIDMGGACDRAVRIAKSVLPKLPAA